MRRLRLWLEHHLQRFTRREHGTAAVEFALILPVMLFVYIGSVEGGALITTDRRVQSVAGALGDLVARSDGTLTNSDLTDYFRAAKGIMTTFGSDTLVQTVTQVKVPITGTPTVVWSKRYTSTSSAPANTTGSRYTKGTAYSLPAEMVTVARSGGKDSFVIVAEAQASYMPLSGFVYTAAIPLYRENFFMPRFGEEIKAE